jgi:hypothetical protein
MTLLVNCTRVSMQFGGVPNDCCCLVNSGFLAHEVNVEFKC